MERTYVMLKPDCVKRGLVGKVLQVFEEQGLKIVGMKMIKPDEDKWKEHYAHHTDKPFFPSLLKFMQLAPVVAVAIEGENAIEIVRKMAGKTDGSEPETIRNELAPNEIQENILHASDSVETAKVEIDRFFKPEELFSYDLDCEKLRFKRS